MVFVLLQAVEHVSGLVVFEDFMYMSMSGNLIKCNKFDCANITELSDPYKHMHKMFLYHPVTQPPCK